MAVADAVPLGLLAGPSVAVPVEIGAVPGLAPVERCVARAPHGVTVGVVRGSRSVRSYQDPTLMQVWAQPEDVDGY
jgi:hypothetical protein